MVDGKGGNLKTIHHYETERILLIRSAFQIIFMKSRRMEKGGDVKPSTDRQFNEPNGN
jgi:hypothetical protein